ncbi:MAG: AMP-binding protein [Candidatus Rokubacteria bacterium]|nr:AMP-binding protein [Candidatus Rokubacteria bacterium]
MSAARYDEVCRTFRWADGLAALDWPAAGTVELGRTIVGRHAASGRTALVWFGADGASRRLTFDELGRLSDRVAHLLRSLGVAPDDRVAGFLPRVAETIAAMIGAWKAGAVWVPIFTGFGPDAVGYRVGDSGARVLVTHRAYRDRVPGALPAGTTVVTIGAGARPPDIDFAAAIAGQPETSVAAPRRRHDPAVLLYTSGSTGPPKGVQIATNFLLAVHPYVAYGLDLRSDDVFWPTGDPGWGYGLVCYMAALARGVAVVSHEAAPTPRSALMALADLGITNLATTPTLLRSIMALGLDAVRRHRVALRRVSSCGEPLNAEVVSFFRTAWDVTVMDHYGSSEFGLPIGNASALDMEVKPGSMGRPFPGCEMAVVDDDGREVAPGVVGQIAMRPSTDGFYALGYWNDVARTRDLSRTGWLTIGDLARRDGGGYFWFEGRADDVIKSAGYRIGPFEVESALLEHPDVAEAAVVGKPDAARGEIVKAYVVLKPGAAPRDGLVGELVDVVRARSGRHHAPREIEVVERLPKTETGKIQRFVLRRRARGEAG